MMRCAAAAAARSLAAAHASSALGLPGGARRGGAALGPDPAGGSGHAHGIDPQPRRGRCRAGA
ncbi:MAG: hypothetical protein MZW92_21960 [Comamonadaceae bacterium]|nr:hypothetical protein [Comamonadaceae bacterium]